MRIREVDLSVSRKQAPMFRSDRGMDLTLAHANACRGVSSQCTKKRGSRRTPDRKLRTGCRDVACSVLAGARQVLIVETCANPLRDLTAGFDCGGQCHRRATVHTVIELDLDNAACSDVNVAGAEVGAGQSGRLITDLPIVLDVGDATVLR